MSAPIYKFLIAHGTTSRPERSWFPWLTWQLLKRGQPAWVPRLPTPQGQTYESWKSAWLAQTPALDDSTVLIGHSTGVPFLLRLLSEHDGLVAGVYLAAGFAEPLNLNVEGANELLAHFVEVDWDWPRIQARSRLFRCYHGKNDPIVALEKGERVVRSVQGSLRIIEDGQHLDTKSGYTEFPELLEDIETDLLNSDPDSGS